MPPVNQTAALNSAIPGFSGLTGNASSYLKELMSGRITLGERNAVYNAGAERGTAGGMPGGSTQSGNIFANNDLRTLGLMAGERQQQGLNGFMQLLQTVSGSVVPTAGQQQQQNQFDADLGFRNTQADRSFGLQQDAQRLERSKFNEQYGPREYSSSVIDNSGVVTRKSPPVFVTPGGRVTSGGSTLMYKYH